MAPLLPKLRGHFAEFLNNASPAGLRILSSSTCVGLRYGYCMRNSGFSWQHGFGNFTTLSSFHITYHHHVRVFPQTLGSPLVPVFPFPALPTFLRPHSSDIQQYRNINLLSIDYASQPRLRSRLTLGGRTFPRKP